jgi:5-formyltetrahydrofolate cyclo-ligase
MALKKDIRQQYKTKRLQLSSSQSEKLSDLLLIQFQQLAIDIPEYIMTYAGIEKMNEFDPHLITDYCHFKNPQQTLMYPVMKGGEDNPHIIAMAVDIDTSFEKNSFDVEEPMDGEQIDPQAIDLVIVPLLAFDESGYRVGYGKGYYDRFLQQCRKDCIKIGFSFFEPVDTIEDVHEHDMPLNFCITPEAIYEFV